MDKQKKWTRRAFLASGALVGGGLLLGVGGMVLAPNRLGIFPEDNDPTDGSQLSTWLKILPDNTVVAIVPHCEMGQGARVGVAMMLAEELDADWNLVRIEEAPPDSVYANGYVLREFFIKEKFVPEWLNRSVDFGTYQLGEIMSLQITGGSASVRATGYRGMRAAGAAARDVLIKAAAARWGVDPSQCSVKNSEVMHPSGKKLKFGELATDAAKIKLPQDPVLKHPKEYTLVGKSQQRPDIPAKVSGQAKYAIDVVLPGMLYAAIMHAPIFGGKLNSVDEAPALALSGVKSVVRLKEAVAVVADSYFTAKKALLALNPVFSDGGNAHVNSESIFESHRNFIQAGKPSIDFSIGDVEKIFPAAKKIFEAKYQVPYLAHAAMEPLCAVAQFTASGCEVWSEAQDPLNARHAAASAAGLHLQKVKFHNHMLGGGFGRKLPMCFDYIEEAVEIAKACSPAPVKLLWSREQDTQRDYFRPAATAFFQGVLGDDGAPLAWACDHVGPGGMDAPNPLYAIPNQRIRGGKKKSHIREGSWRSVDFSSHTFFVESFIDELAVAAGRDPYEFRKNLLAQKPRHLAVLDRAAKMAHWWSPLPAGEGRGIALVECFGTILAMVVHARVDAEKKISALHIHAAVDCGIVVNPQGAISQIEGAVHFGLSAALFQEITIKNGQVEQRSFPDYPVITFADAPRVWVELIPSLEAPGGMGEPGVPCVAPALANAVYAITKQRMRQLPLQKNFL